MKQRIFPISFTVFFLFLAVIGRTGFFSDADAFWHTAVGRQILQSGLIYEDSFSHTFAGQPWFAQCWLYESTTAIVDRFTGFDGLLIVFAASIASVMALVFTRMVRYGLHSLVACLFTAFVFGASSSDFHIRPNITTFVLMGWMYAFFCDIEEKRVSTKALWGLIPVFILWTNLHGGVLGGIGTVGLVLCGWIATAVLGLDSPITGRRQGIGLALLVVAILASTLVNPYGTIMHDAWFEILSMSLPDLIIEHAPLDPMSPRGQLVLAFGAVYLFCLLGTWGARPRITWLVPLVWLLLAVTRVRHGSLFAVTAGIALASMLPHTYWWRILLRRELATSVNDTAASVTLRPKTVLVALALPCLLLIVTLVLKSSDGSNYRQWSRPTDEVWPQELIPYLAERTGHGDNTVAIFNDYNYGGFLIYRFPEAKVFIDGRCELYEEPFLREFVEASNDPSILDRWQLEFPSQLALVRTKSAFDTYFSNTTGWQLVHRTPTSSLFERNNKAATQ